MDLSLSHFHLHVLCDVSVHRREAGEIGHVLWLMNQSVGSVIQQIALLLMLWFCKLEQEDLVPL